jgi:hypothetical protein
MALIGDYTHVTYIHVPGIHACFKSAHITPKGRNRPHVSTEDVDQNFLLKLEVLEWCTYFSWRQRPLPVQLRNRPFCPRQCSNLNACEYVRDANVDTCLLAQRVRKRMWSWSMHIKGAWFCRGGCNMHGCMYAHTLMHMRRQFVGNWAIRVCVRDTDAKCLNICIYVHACVWRQVLGYQGMRVRVRTIDAGTLYIPRRRFIPHLWL